MSQEQLIQPKKALPPLSVDEVKKARIRIAETHELSTTPFSDVFPILKTIREMLTFERSTVAQAGSDQEKGQVQAARKKKKRIPKEQREDPFNQLGFGLVAYRDLMFVLAVLFAILSLIMYPVMSYYSQQDGYTNPQGYGKLSLGNFGYSSVQCNSAPYQLNKLAVNCPFGSVGQIYSAGVLPGNETDKSICQLPENSLCQASKLKDFITSQLQGQASKTSSLTFTHADVFGETTPDAQCTNNRARIFVSYSCTQSEDLLRTKYNQTIVISCLAVFLVIVFMSCLHYFKNNSNLQQKEWDISTITPGDYTVQYEITDKAYDYFLTHIYRKESPKSKGAQLKAYMKEQIEKILTDKLREMRAEDPLPEAVKNISIETVKIADIVFAFENAQLIQLLRVRGQHIMNERYPEMRAVENEINELKDLKLPELVKPCDAFITFEEEDGSIVAQTFEPEYTFFGSKLPAEKIFMEEDFHLVEATEPTNIIWENRHWTAADYAKRGAIVFGIIMFLLLASFLTIYYCKLESIENSSKYPSVVYEDVLTAYGYNASLPAEGQESAIKLIKTNALLEFNNFFHYTEMNLSKPIALSGIYQSFCEILDPTHSRAFNNTKVSGNEKEVICDQYNDDKLSEIAWNQAVKFLIIGVNYILRVLIIKLIIYIGKDTESEQTKLITNGVFIVQFFNTALLLLLVNGNFTEQSWIPQLFSRHAGHADFNSHWFQDIGNTLVGAMLFNTYWPLFEFFTFYCMRATFRLMDRRFRFKIDENREDAKVTKKTTLQQYIEMYSGPVFFIHYKYSSILNITFVTMMYGLGLPILFPIASASIFTLYFVEKLMLHYSYREPPMYDETLNENALNLLSYAPLVFCSFGYWMLSSKQLLSNDYLTPLQNSDSERAAYHFSSEVFESSTYSWANPAFPLLLTFWVVLFFTFFRNTLYFCITYIIPYLAIGDFEIDEGLPNYFKTLDNNDRNWSQEEEKYSREKLGFAVVDDATLQAYKDNERADEDEDAPIPSKKGPEPFIKGTHCYDILANEKYQAEFQYFSPALGEERADWIKDDDEDEGNDDAQSDLVKVALNLAFLTEYQAAKFKFSKDYITELSSAKKNTIN